MAANKWELDVMPVMESSPNLRSLKPTSGAGSAGGKIKDMVTLRDGVAIKLMSAGSQDTGKAGFTSRVLGVTEAARFSTAGESSVEADPLRQLRARQRSYEEHERFTYVEGTVTLETDLPWRFKPLRIRNRYTSDSLLHLPFADVTVPKCGKGPELGDACRVTQSQRIDVPHFVAGLASCGEFGFRQGGRSAPVGPYPRVEFVLLAKAS